LVLFKIAKHYTSSVINLLVSGLARLNNIQILPIVRPEGAVAQLIQTRLIKVIYIHLAYL